MSVFRDLHVFRRGMGSLLRDFDRSFGFGPSPAEWLYDPFGTRAALLRANSRRAPGPVLVQRPSPSHHSPSPSSGMTADNKYGPASAVANPPDAAATAAPAASNPTPSSATTTIPVTNGNERERERDYDRENEVHSDAFALWDPFASAGAGPVSLWGGELFGRGGGGGPLSKVHPANEWLNAVRPISLDIVERDNDFTVSADVPGMSKADLKLTIDPHARTLTLAGERHSHYEEGTQKDAAPNANAAADAKAADAAAAAAAVPTDSAAAARKPFRRIERAFGSVSRTIALPANVDPNRITAKHENGVLTICLPKDSAAAAAAGPKAIAIA